MTQKKPKREKKEKRAIPVRARGELIADENRPSKVLFDLAAADEAKLLAKDADSTIKTFPDSTVPKIVESTIENLVDSLAESTKPILEKAVDSTSPPKEKSGVHQKAVVDSRKLDRHSKHKQRIQPRIDKGILKRIKGFCLKQDIELGEYIEMLAVHHLDLVDSAKNKEESPQMNKMIIYRADERIINLYQSFLPKNKWTWSDDKEAVKFSDVSLEVIEFAMIRTIIRAKTPIRSFKYFVPEIEFEASLNTNEVNLKMQLASAQKAFALFKRGIAVEIG